MGRPVPWLLAGSLVASVLVAGFLGRPTNDEGPNPSAPAGKVEAPVTADQSIQEAGALQSPGALPAAHTTREADDDTDSEQPSAEVDRSQELRSLERKILNVIAENASGISSLDVHCSITRCEAIVVSPTRGFAEHFLTVLTREFMRSGLGFGSLGIRPLTASTAEFTMYLPSLEEALFPVDAEGRAVVSLTRQDLEDMAKWRPLESEYDKDPATLGRFGEASVILEVYCRSDCSEGAQRLLRLEPDEGKSCREVGGEEIYLGTAEGVPREICLPEFLKFPN